MLRWSALMTLPQFYYYYYYYYYYMPLVSHTHTHTHTHMLSTFTVGWLQFVHV